MNARRSLRGVVTDRAAQHRVAGLQRVQHCLDRHRTLDLDLDLAVDAGQRHR